MRIPVDAPIARDRSVVLFVSEDAGLRAAAERALGDAGYDVVPAAHAGHALLVCLAGQRVDVLVTELAMRDTSGPRLADTLRRYFPSLPVVYIGERGPRDSDALPAPPFTRDDLLERLAVALRGARA